MSKEAMKLALEALEKADRHCPVNTEAEVFVRLSITALREALAQPVQPTSRNVTEKEDRVLTKALLKSGKVIFPAQPVQQDNTAKLYEELRVLIDGGSESFTHEDAVQYLKDNLAPLKWTPEDMAHRPGGLPQPELSDYQCCDCKTRLFCGADCHVCGSFGAEDIPQEHPEQMARLGWQYVECPACGLEGARAFSKPDEQPAQRTWVGLTDEDIFLVLGKLQAIYNRPPTEDSRIVFAHAIEAKLKEKNT